MTKNTKTRLYYQKFLPGDIIRTEPFDKLGVVIRCSGSFGSFYYEYYTLDIDDSYYRLNDVNKKLLTDDFSIRTTKVVYKSFMDTSDILCKRVCKYPDNCDLCNFKIDDNFSPNKLFFLGDRVNVPVARYYPVNDRKGIVRSMRIIDYDDYNNNLRNELNHSLSKQDPFNLKDWIEIVKCNSDNLTYMIQMERTGYELKFESSDIRLNQRRGYTLDPGVMTKTYCDQCIDQDCENCIITEHNFNQKFKEIN